jgi:hypothetical protein
LPALRREQAVQDLLEDGLLELSKRETERGKRARW